MFLDLKVCVDGIDEWLKANQQPTLKTCLSVLMKQLSFNQKY